jgi:glycosyltransferase involved in cell wall biosynthesis
MFVSIIMPIRNEADFIARSLGAVLAQDYPPDQLEILIVDGMSEDNTRSILQQTLAQVTRPIQVYLLDNPARIVPTALNLGLKHARGAVIIRVDGHCEIAPDYVQRCVDALARSQADCVGGPMLTVGETSMARAIALAQSSSFGVGGVAFRTGRQKRGYVDTVAFGAYRREIFERIGGFDEELVRNQDDEFNFRLTQAGGKIWLDPAIRSTYYSRATLVGLWRQYREYGWYKVRVIQKRGALPAYRHVVPAAFVLALLGSLLLALLTRRRGWLWSVAGPYTAANGLATLLAARRDWRTTPLLPLAFATLHLAYGVGFLQGVLHILTCSRR